MARRQPRGAPQPPGPPFPSLAPLPARGRSPPPARRGSPRGPVPPPPTRWSWTPAQAPSPVTTEGGRGRLPPLREGDPLLGGLHRHRRPPRTNATQRKLPAQHLSVSAPARPGAEPPRAASAGSPSAADKAAALPASGNSVPRARRSAEPRAEEATHISLQRDFS